MRIKKFFLSAQKNDPIIKQIKFRHKHKIKPTKADITKLENKTLHQNFRKFKKKATNENPDILEYHYVDTKVNR